MKPLALILACLLSAGLPVRSQPVQGLTSELISANFSPKSNIQPYRYDPVKLYEKSGTTGSFSYLETDRRRTRGDNMVRGLGIGLGIGAIGGGAIGALSWTECNEEKYYIFCDMNPESRGDAFLLGAVLGGGLGGIVGLIVGFASKTGQRNPPVSLRMNMAPIPSEQLSYSPSVTFNLQLKSKR